MLPWKPIDGSNEEEDNYQHVTFAIEELDVPYSVVDGKIVLDGAPKEGKKRALKQEKGAKKAKIVQEVTKEVEEVELPEWDNLGLNSIVLNGLQGLGFLTPTPIQRLCIPAVLARGRDVLGIAETGSGKTLAYGLPIITKLIDSGHDTSVHGLGALVITPTRELAQQVTKHLRDVVKSLEGSQAIGIESMVGGVSEQKQERLLNRKPHIVVGTIGRIMAWIGAHEYMKNLHETLEFLVIDEADRMADSLHLSDIVPFLDFMDRGEKKKKYQTLLFSATLLNNEDFKRQKKGKDSAKKSKVKLGPEYLMERLGRRGKPELCDVNGRSAEITEEAARSKVLNTSSKSTTEKTPSKSDPGLDQASLKLPDSLKLYRIECTEKDKEIFLHWTVETGDSKLVLVFVNTIPATKRIAATLALSLPNSEVSSLHAKMDQKQRLRNLEKFKGEGKNAGSSEKQRILVASDVASRGLDIPAVDMVVQYGTPRRIDTYVHRSGRCGRAGRSGTVVVISSGAETKELSKIRNAIKPRTMDSYPVNELEIRPLADRVRVCQQLHKLTSQRDEMKQEASWKKRAIEEADLEVDSDYEEGNAEDVRHSAVKRSLARSERVELEERLNQEIGSLKRQLKILLKDPKAFVTQNANSRRGKKKLK